MIKKLIISAVVLTALISGKEAKAAGAGGFARALSSVPVVQVPAVESRSMGTEERMVDEALIFDPSDSRAAQGQLPPAVYHNI
ncbi:hypothetical protein EDE05_103410 [Neorhizobium sp. R1-B]|uniref:hypothetical protein n=1 Tax=Neorhizobium TaxID=1525371 RepID=UPI000CFA7EA3|nr:MULTISPECIES: hypothetical protein [Neorhizobium]TCV74654.1 hypothetical protein EDE09_102410 [Neorhizobium sp. S3-V5DH]TDX87840.1 hypothetical protein EDE05_103410 [Neorhizobium sp. R1-B]